MRGEEGIRGGAKSAEIMTSQKNLHLEGSYNQVSSVQTSKAQPSSVIGESPWYSRAPRQPRNNKSPAAYMDSNYACSTREATGREHCANNATGFNPTRSSYILQSTREGERRWFLPFVNARCEDRVRTEEEEDRVDELMLWCKWKRGGSRRE